MPRLSFLPVIARELLTKEGFERIPEPELIMDDPAQVAAYAEAGRVDGIMAAGYLFHAARASQAIAGARQVVDLGCGPATQLVQIARVNPDIEFLGLDLSETMLADAERHAMDAGVRNVRFERADITRLEGIGDSSVDAVVSTMTLHHLPDRQVLGKCFAEVRRILAPNGALYIADFTRLKSLASVGFFVGMNADRQPVLFTQDYENSLKAAFSIADYDRLLEQYLPQNARRYSVFLVPLLTVIQTPPRALAPGAREQFRAARRALPDNYRRDLDDLRLFMRLGGMHQDPFSSR